MSISSHLDLMIIICMFFFGRGSRDGDLPCTGVLVYGLSIEEVLMPILHDEMICLNYEMGSCLGWEEMNHMGGPLECVCVFCMSVCGCPGVCVCV